MHDTKVNFADIIAVVVEKGHDAIFMSAADVEFFIDLSLHTG